MRFSAIARPTKFCAPSRGHRGDTTTSNSNKHKIKGFHATNNAEVCNIQPIAVATVAKCTLVHVEQHMKSLGSKESFIIKIEQSEVQQIKLAQDSQNQGTRQPI